MLAEMLTNLILTYENISVSLQATQAEKLKLLEKNNILWENELTWFHDIRKLGNRASHENTGTTADAIKMIWAAFQLVNMFVGVYIDLEFEVNDFSEITEYIDLHTQLEQENEELKKRLEELQSQIQAQPQTKQQHQARKQAKTGIQDKINLTEHETRVNIIDKWLVRAGWEADTENLTHAKGVVPKKNKKFAISEYPTTTGLVDYALFDGFDCVGIVEAKKYNENINNFENQVKRYATDLNVRFVYITNGRDYNKLLEDRTGVKFHDTQNPFKPAVHLSDFHSPQDLREKQNQDTKTAKEKLEQEKYPEYANRPYQLEAIKSTEEAVKNGQRQMLLALATGTGKTRLAIALMYRLIASGLVNRILFLVDRTSLGEQTAGVLKDLNITNLEDYISQYRRVIEYFDAAILGLTATPAKHTAEIETYRGVNI